MDNYSAILKMNRIQLEAFLDDVYCTGLNNGLYAARQPDGDDEILDRNPFDKDWLTAAAEPATLCAECEDGDTYLLEAYAQAVIRNAGLDGSQPADNADYEEK